MSGAISFAVIFAETIAGLADRVQATSPCTDGSSGSFGIDGTKPGEVARSVGNSPAHLPGSSRTSAASTSRTSSRIAETLGEKAGDLLPNDVGAIAHLKPLIRRLASVEPELLPRLAAIINGIVLLTEQVSAAGRTRKNAAAMSPSTKRRPAKRKGRP